MFVKLASYYNANPNRDVRAKSETVKVCFVFFVQASKPIINAVILFVFAPVHDNTGNKGILEAIIVQKILRTNQHSGVDAR